ncbi:uncharacterized protein BJX67DRAFT_161214 [Aspergillus lucknowensis]|uniref:Uncharacterized protein n=1 Tax=Aspergillus lucknowensis TaxID=176173 RepID=A0ABR4M4D3_9EURO
MYSTDIMWPEKTKHNNKQGFLGYVLTRTNSTAKAKRDFKEILILQPSFGLEFIWPPKDSLVMAQGLMVCHDHVPFGG